jgi:hypothetical protein
VPRLTIASLLLALFVALPACERNVFHVFGGYSYDADAGCLYKSGAIDVIDGPDPGKCKKVKCWIGPAGQVVVTDTACDAPLDYTDGTAEDAGACPAALEAYEGEDHSRCPAPPDGGS